MDAAAIRALISVDPFLPLRVRVNDGSEYRVTLPEQIAVFGPDSVKTLLVGSKRIPFDAVQSMSPEPVPPAFEVNGHGAAMTIEKFDEFLKRRPFVPFTLHVADGGSFEVKGPEFASRTESGRTIFVATGGETTEWIDLLLVTRISSGINNPTSSARKD